MKTLIVFLLLSSSAMADTYGDSHSSLAEPKIEIGAVVGYPVLAGLTVGYWGSGSLPIVARFSTGVGSTLDIGWGFSKNEDDIRAYIGATVGVFGYLGILSQTQWFIGPSVGIRWNSIFVGLGPTVRFENGSYARLLAMGQLGFSGLF
jgi:hypothetical protein